MAVERTGTCSHEDNGELPEEKRTLRLGLAKWSISCSAQRMMRSASCPLRRTVCYEGGRNKFAVPETKRGMEVAKTGRFFEALQEEPAHKL